MKTLTISLPQTMYEDAKKTMAQKNYTSISELIRDSLKKILYPNLTENGFTKEFEDQVLQAASEPLEEGTLLETDADIENYFLRLKKPKGKK